MCRSLGTEFAGLGNGDLVTLCHEALRALSTSEENFQALMGDFMSFSIESNELFETLKEWQPNLIWVQVASNYPALSAVLCEVYRAPASTAGVERNHKVMKRVLTKTRCRTGDNKVERQVFIAHNSAQIKRSVNNRRGIGFLKVLVDAMSKDLSPTGADGEVPASEICSNEEGMQPYDEIELDELEMDALLQTALAPVDILDEVLFNKAGE